MGDQGGGAAGGVLPSGLLPNVAVGFTRALDMDRWMKAEERTDELIARIQPTWPSEERRNAVASYVQRLITNCFSCKVFTYGSVPLKTYLPDGDIDLTAFSENESLKDTWANEVRDALESEEKNENAEFCVKEVQYIQAEVKIIKCLVEDIVVDISFSQVGGLCTLCFLDEIDILINRNHLFKRSIILIKAWCYYESRILGAHHGLISTYALETLVLYTFHLYNNCFAGPLEVLYRFLEFFSNFDWENFCVSLWGPVPIRSLPDIIVEPPRKDGGELLLSKLFLDACSTLYAVLPAGQESPVQTFVPKHFNVIDPLRISNNLGRSVSKGNFFRIRSAFAFGAKRLARLFECPNEDLVTEVNLFFTNTWGRHQSGNRPDAPSRNLLHLRPMEGVPADGSTNAKNENNTLLTGHDYEADAGLGSTSQVLKMVNQHFQSMYKRSIPSALYHVQYQRNYASQIDSEISDNVDRNISATDFAQPHINQNSFWPDHSLNIHEGQNLFQIARGHSSPELNDSSPELLAQVSYNKIQTGKTQFPPAILNHGNRRNHVGIEDPSASRHLPHQNLEVADSNGALNSYLDHAEELTSVSETLDMHQEEQDLVNMMASSGLHNGQLQFPVHFPSHVPFPMVPSLVPSMAYNQRNMAGAIPPNIAVIDPSWGSNVQYPQGFVPSPISHYSSTVGLNINKNDMTGPVNGSSGMVGINSEDIDQDVWREDDVGSNRSDSDNVGFQIFPSDDKKQIRGRPNVVSSTEPSNSSASSVRGHHKVARENGEQLNENDTVLQHHSRKGNDTHPAVGTANVGSFPSSKGTSLRNKPASESSSDGSEKAAKSARDKQGRRLAASAIRTALYGNSKNVRQLEGSSDSSVQADDEASPHARNPQLPASDPADLNGPDSMVQIKPMPVSSSQHRTVENSVPFAFYPTGPPVPFLAMLPFYNIPSGTGGSDASESQFDNDQRLDHIVRNPSGQSFDLDESQIEIQTTSNSLRNSTHELTEVHTSDILKSDFTSHWQNLQYGRYCQNIRNQGPFMYPPPVVVPPGYLQGQFPWDGPGRPPANMNVFTQFAGYGPRMVPTAPLQPGLQRNPVFQHYRDEVPRYRGGTGTYLPNPKVPFRERSSSSTRNQRGNYNHDRNDADREGSWSNAKYRAAGRGHGRVQAEKPDLRPDRSSTSDTRTDRRWNSHRLEPSDSYQGSAGSFGSRKSSHGSTNIAYGMYTMPAVNSNGTSSSRPAAPALKLYTYDQGVMYGSHAEPLNFGPLGPTHLSGGSDIAEPGDGSSAREGYQQRHGTYRGSSRSSPG